MSRVHKKKLRTFPNKSRTYPYSKEIVFRLDWIAREPLSALGEDAVISLAGDTCENCNDPKKALSLHLQLSNGACNARASVTL